MLLQDILTKYEWTPYGIVCPDIETTRKVHTFLREAILDRHIYIGKVIGFEINSSVMERPHVGTYIARHKQISESYPEVMLHLMDKVFMVNSSCDAMVVMNTGMNTVNNREVYANSKIIDCLYTDESLCRVIDKECILKLKILYDCGYRNTAMNSHKVGSDYFPCNTDFYLGDYFKVLPPNFSSNVVSIRYYNGGSVDILKQILATYCATIVQGKLRKEEKIWVQSFEQ